jgi:5-methylcytosine-specific restriction endonuclease McrA
VKNSTEKSVVRKTDVFVSNIPNLLVFLPGGLGGLRLKPVNRRLMFAILNNEVVKRVVMTDTTLRPDQLAKKRREEAAAKKLLEQSRKPTKFKPIVLLGDKKAKKRNERRRGKRFCYCHTCLRKYRFKSYETTTSCLDCGVELRQVKSLKALAGVVTRVKLKRGLKRPKSKKGGGYDEYLKSPLWKTIRKRILDRDLHLCRDCGEKAQHVHHLSYAAQVMSGEDDSKLISLCVPCHDARHPDKPSMVRPARN